MDGHKEILGTWISENESASFYASICSDLKNRGVEDIFVACHDNLTGLCEAINSIFPKTKNQLCIVHRIRNSCKFVFYKDRKEVCADLKKIYGAINLVPQLITEIGDTRRFHSRKAITAFAGLDAPPYQSGNIDVKSRSISKRGSPHLRRTLLQVVDVILKNSHADESVYKFLDKKRAEGKQYKVYMMAAVNKFLRIYYAKVNEVLNA